MIIPRRCLRVLAPPLIALVLGSCGPQRNEFAPACPVPAKPRPVRDLARYRGESRDFRDLIIRAEIVDVTGECVWGDNKNSVVATPTVVINATRGPAMEGDAISLPVFVAISGSGTILDKIAFWLPVKFAPNIDVTSAVSEEVRMEIPVSPTTSAAAYDIIGGFQLTPDEVAAWRRDNRR
jgi:hypothetical protein